MKKFLVELPPPGDMVQIASNTRAREVGEFMATLCRQLSLEDPLTQKLSAIVRQDPARNLPRLVQEIYASIFFVPDPITKQILRTPEASIRENAGNCVDYTIILGSICHCAGLPVTIRLVKFQPDTDFVHVYPIINGVPIDLVIGQRQDGTEKTSRQNKNFDHLGEQVKSFAFFDIII